MNCREVDAEASWVCPARLQPTGLPDADTKPQPLPSQDPQQRGAASSVALSVIMAAFLIPLKFVLEGNRGWGSKYNNQQAVCQD